jgi:antirestriction protein ArdC
MSRHTGHARTGHDRTGLYQEITDKIIADLEAGPSVPITMRQMLAEV